MIGMFSQGRASFSTDIFQVKKHPLTVDGTGLVCIDSAITVVRGTKFPLRVGIPPQPHYYNISFFFKWHMITVNNTTAQLSPTLEVSNL